MLCNVFCIIIILVYSTIDTKYQHFTVPVFCISFVYRKESIYALNAATPFSKAFIASAFPAIPRIITSLF